MCVWNLELKIESQPIVEVMKEKRLNQRERARTPREEKHGYLFDVAKHKMRYKN